MSETVDVMLYKAIITTINRKSKYYSRCRTEFIVPEQEIPKETLSGQVTAAELALRPTGVLGQIAEKLVHGEGVNVALSSEEAGDVLLPNRDATTPRWRLLEGAPQQRVALYEANRDQIFRTAREVGILQDESLPDGALECINLSNAVWIVEGGANKTHLVRPELAFRAMEKLGIDERRAVFEINGSRAIPRTRADSTENPEYKISMGLAPDYLKDGDALTEFGVKRAVALQQGYEVVSDVTTEDFARVLRLKNEHNERVIIQPMLKNEQGVEAGLTVVDALLRHEGGQSLEGRQIVGATNGQYRTKLALQVRHWAKKHATGIDGVVVLGDEAGFTLGHLGQEHTTLVRSAALYANEIVIIERASRKLAATE